MDAKWILLVHVAILHTVTSAPESVFAQEGNSVTLTMDKRVNLDPDDAVWVFNQTRDVVRYYPHHPKSRQLRVLGPYRGRVEFDSTTFCLELKNLQKTDCGIYRGEINAEGRKTFIEYKLSVYEQVSAPVLAVEPVLSSGDLCNVAVNCTAGDLSLTSTCNSMTCSQKELPESSNIAIFIEDGVIICSHSDLFSRRQATVDFENVCPQAQNSDKLNTSVNIAIAGGLMLLVLSGMLLICGCCFSKQSKSPEPNMAKVCQIVERIIPNGMLPGTKSGTDQSERKNPVSAVSPSTPSRSPMMQSQTPGSTVNEQIPPTPSYRCLMPTPTQGSELSQRHVSRRTDSTTPFPVRKKLDLD